MSDETPPRAGVRRSLAACALLLLLPGLANWQALSGWLDASPLYVTSGLMDAGRSGPLPGFPGWIDPNAGLTMQALGRLAAEQWLHGRVPWWNPYSGVGMPLAAEMQPAALFLPFVLLMHFSQGLIFVKVALQAVAGLSTWGLLRALGTCRLAALLGAALFEMNGTFSFVGHAAMYPSAFLPLLLLGLERAAAWRRDARAVIAAALAASLYAGFPEVAYLNGLLALAWAGRLVWRAPGRRVTLVGEIAAGGAAGLLLAAPCVWPFLHLLMHATLNDGDVGHRFAGVSAPIQGFAPLLLPFLFGPAAAFAAQDPSGGIAATEAFLGGSLAVTTLFWALLSLAGRRRRDLRALLAAWVIVCLGRTFGAPVLSPLVDAVPLVGQTMFFRYAGASQELAVAVLAAFAIDDFSRAGLSHDRARRAAPFAACAAACLGAGAIACAWPSVRASWSVPAFQVCLAATLAWAAIYVGAAAWLARGPAAAGRRAALGALVLAECVAVFNLPLFAGLRDARIDVTSVAFLQGRAGLQRLYTLGPLRANYGAYFGVASINAEYLPVPDEWAAYVRGALDPGASLVMFRGDEPPSPARADALRTRLAAYEALGVRYVAAHPGENPFRETTELRPAAGDRAAVRLDDGQTMTGTIPARAARGAIDRMSVEVATYAARASGRLAVELCDGERCARGETDLEQARDGLPLAVDLAPALETDGAALRWRIAMLGPGPLAVWLGPDGGAPQDVEGPDGPRPGLAPALARSRPAAGSSPPRVYAGEAMDVFELPDAAPYFSAEGGPCALAPAGREKVDAECEAPATLVRRELDFPGWRARVDGRLVAVGHAAPLFQAVALPAGRSRVRFAYAPPWIGLCWAAAALGLAWLAMAMRPGRRVL
jgi:hypothetical protein